MRFSNFQTIKLFQLKEKFKNKNPLLTERKISYEFGTNLWSRRDGVKKSSIVIHPLDSPFMERRLKKKIKLKFIVHFSGNFALFNLELR